MGAASCVQSYGPRTNGRLDAVDARVSHPAGPVLRWTTLRWWPSYVGSCVVHAVGLDI